VLRRVGTDIIVEAERPLVYLDFWAWRQLSTEHLRGGRFLAGLRRRGTLLISPTTILEFQGISGPSFDRVVGFVRDVGARWAPVTVNVSDVAVREMAGYAGPPWVDRDLIARLRLDENLSLAQQIVEMASARRPRREWAHLASTIERTRTALKNRSGVWRGAPGSAAVKSLWLLDQLNGLIVKDRFRFDRNHGDDYTHALAVAYADVVFLDGHWANLVQRLHLSPRDFARVFAPPQIEKGLSHLELAWWS
jgi:hypothetical protein